jgi:thymidylate synthase
MGDLGDLVELLRRSPNTRQAYLPVFFPEDTGAHHGERIPCTLGYHFQQREGVLSMWYFLRSCDYTRHFRDDCFLAIGLLDYLIKEVNPNWKRGVFHMVIPSLHMFINDWNAEKGKQA